MNKIAFCCTSIAPTSKILSKNINFWTSNELGECFISLDRKNPDFDGMISYLRNSTTEYEKMCGYDTYSRKNIAFLEAVAAGYKYIFETDDDNLVLEPPDPSLISSHFEYRSYSGNLFSHIYSVHDRIWARGYPLSWIDDKEPTKLFDTTAGATVGVVQYLVKGNPDVDAIYRLVNGDDIDLTVRNDALPVILNTYHPFNSQGTLWGLLNFPLMYLPETCQFRMTDIYRGYIAQRIMHEFNEVVVFEKPILNQLRNEHKISRDFFGEHSGYIDTIKIIDTLYDISLNGSREDMLIKLYTQLTKIGIFHSNEVKLVHAWIKSLEKYSDNTD